MFSRENGIIFASAAGGILLVALLIWMISSIVDIDDLNERQAKQVLSCEETYPGFPNTIAIKTYWDPIICFSVAEGETKVLGILEDN